MATLISTTEALFLATLAGLLPTMLVCRHLDSFGEPIAERSVGDDMMYGRHTSLPNPAIPALYARVAAGAANADVEHPRWIGLISLTDN